MLPLFKCQFDDGPVPKPARGDGCLQKCWALCAEIGAGLVPDPRRLWGWRAFAQCPELC